MTVAEHSNSMVLCRAQWVRLNCLTILLRRAENSRHQNSIIALIITWNTG